MPDGSIIITTELDNKQLEKDYQRTLKKVQSLEGALRQKQNARLPLVEQAQQLSVELDRAKQALHEMQNSRGGYSADAIKEQEETVKSLQFRWNKVQSEVERYDASITRINGQIEHQKELGGAVAQQLAQVGRESSRMGDAIDRAGKHMDRFTNRVKQLMTRALVFTVISKALGNLRDWMGKVIKTNDKAVAAIARLKGAWLTLVQPLVNVVIPAFIAFVNVLSRALEELAKFVSWVFGTTAEESAKAADALDKETDALDGVGNAAKKAGKQLAAFDELNQIGSEDSTGSAETGGIAPDFSAFDAENFKDKISALETFISGALLVLGAVLVFSGANIPLGLGLMAAGAIGLAASLSEDWEKVPGRVQATITTLLIILGAVAIVFGVIFLFTGHIGLGLGLIVSGMAMLWTATQLGVDWDSVPPEIQKAIATILTVLAITAIVFGVIFLFTGHVGLGLGLIVAGMAVLWAANELGVGWDTVPPKIQGIITSIMMILGGVAIAFGVIFLFTGHVGLGLGLIVAGAALLWGANALGFSWGSIPPKVQDVITTVLTILGAVAIVFGVILLFTGNVGFGIALILLGAVALWGAKKLGFNWDSLPPKVQSTIETIVKIVAGAALVIGTILLFTGNIPLGLALIGISAVSFFGLSGGSLSSKGPYQSLAGLVGDGLDDVEREIRMHERVFEDESNLLGRRLPEGLTVGIGDGKNAVQDAIVDTLESGIKAGDKAMDINSPSGVTEAQADDMVAGWVIVLAHGAIIVGDKALEIMDALKLSVADSQPEILRVFKNMFNSILDSTETFINRYLSHMRDMLQETATMLSSLPDAPYISVPQYSMVNIPRLAQGAVIPPNREFLAVLGDQKSGNNLEGPESMFRGIVREEMAHAGVGQGGQQQGDIYLTLDGTVFARITAPYFDANSRRVGTKLTNGGVI